MASVEPRLTRRNGKPAKVYDVRFRDPDGRQRKKTFGKKTEADRFAATVEADSTKPLNKRKYGVDTVQTRFQIDF